MDSSIGWSMIGPIIGMIAVEIGTEIQVWQFITDSSKNKPLYSCRPQLCFEINVNILIRTLACQSSETSLFLVVVWVGSDIPGSLWWLVNL